MIRQANRFHGYGSLRYVYRNGQTVRGPLLGLRYGLNKKRDTYRLAVVVSKKINKSAVVRNRIRRRLYEVMRQAADKIDQPYDLVLTVFQDNFDELPAEELEKQVLGLLEQAGVTSSRVRIESKGIKEN